MPRIRLRDLKAQGASVLEQAQELMAQVQEEIIEPTARIIAAVDPGAIRQTVTDASRAAADLREATAAGHASIDKVTAAVDKIATTIDQAATKLEKLLGRLPFLAASPT